MYSNESLFMVPLRIVIFENYVDLVSNRKRLRLLNSYESRIEFLLIYISVSLFTIAARPLRVYPFCVVWRLFS